MSFKGFIVTCMISIAPLLSGCGEDVDRVSTRFVYTKTLPQPVPFVLPAGRNTLGTPTAKAEAEGGVLNPQPYQHPNTWAVYLASSVYTDGSTDRSQRWQIDRQHLISLTKFLKANNLKDKVKVVWLQYDEALPHLNLLSLEGARWDFMPLAMRWADTINEFDYYVISPASRYGSPYYMRYDQWLSPYLWHEDTEDGQIVRSFDIESGLHDYKSKIWDKWNRHFLLVNPDGMVVDSWISIGGNLLQVFPDKVMAALAHHFKLDPDDVEYPDVNFHAHYHSEYKPSLEQQTVEVFNDVAEKMNDR